MIRRSAPDGHPPEVAEARGRRLITNISVATRLALVALLVTLLSLAVTAAVGLRRGNQLADGITEDRLVTIAASRAAEVETYLRSVQREVAALASSPGTTAAIADLYDGYAQLAAEPASASDSRDLTEYYLTDIAPQLEAVRGLPVGASFLIPERPATVRLQALYTIPQVPDDGSNPIDRAFVVDAGDGSAYSATHASIHPVYGGIMARSRFNDLYLIDARDGTIVYSVRKRIDFATSLDAGPLSGSALSTLISSIADEPHPGTSSVADFSPYPPLGDRAVAFVASPVTDEAGTVTGYLAVALDTTPFDDILSGGGEWSELGTTGDSYLVGADGTMRTTSRAYAETPLRFSAGSDDGPRPELTEDQRRQIARTGSTALVQPIGREVLTDAADGSSVENAVNYLGEDVVTAFRPIRADGVDWVVFAEVGRGELDGPIESYARNMLFAVALFVVAVTFIAVRWSNRLMAPIRAVASRLRSIRNSGSDESAHDVPPDSPTEYLALSANIDEMIARLGQRRREVAERSAERTRLVAKFLPAAVAQRTQDGDGDVLDHVRNGSVAVLVLDGLGPLVEQMDDRSTRDLLRAMVDEVDALATDFGLERVKVTGESYVAVCGVSRPVLDHPSRAVNFALAARELVAELADDRDAALTVRAGVDCGIVSVGLSGRDRLVYDTWGEAVSGATQLARLGAPGTINASAAVAEQLPRDVVVVGDSSGGPVVVTARVGEGSS